MSWVLKFVLFYACFAISFGATSIDTCDKTTVFKSEAVDGATAKLIENLHNNLRLMVTKGYLTGQPRGEKLETMYYDKELAESAGEVSKTCASKHIEIKDSRFSVGQNIYTSWTNDPDDCDKPDWIEAVQKWFNEHKGYEYPGRKTSSKAIGHYTQIVWAPTYKVGCHYTCYRDKTEQTKIIRQYTCNYGPGGNMEGVRPYNRWLNETAPRI